ELGVEIQYPEGLLSTMLFRWRKFRSQGDCPVAVKSEEVIGVFSHRIDQLVRVVWPAFSVLVDAARIRSGAAGKQITPVEGELGVSAPATEMLDVTAQLIELAFATRAKPAQNLFKIRVDFLPVFRCYVPPVVASML